jgi:hypothetical protein
VLRRCGTNTGRQGMRLAYTRAMTS